jgi:probable phosphoglycerate mutase
MVGDVPGVDPSLDDLGREQAELVASALAAGTYGDVVGVASSTMRRALETARPAAKLLELAVTADRRLVELDEGSTSYGNGGFTDFPTRREAWDSINAGRWSGHVFDPAAFVARVVEGMEAVLEFHRSGVGASSGAEDALAVFCHGGVISAFVGHVARTAQPLFTSPDHASVTRILIEPDGYREVLSLNERAHLDRRTSASVHVPHAGPSGVRDRKETDRP